MKVAEFVETCRRRPPATARGMVDLLGAARLTGPATRSDALELVQLAGKLLAEANKMALLFVRDLLAGPDNSPHFIHLSNNLVACQLVMRLLDPTRFEQNGFNLCGPASVAYILAQA